MFIKLTLWLVQRQADIWKLPEHRLQGFVVDILGFCEHDDIITDVQHSLNVMNLLTNGVLEYLTCQIGTKIQSGVPFQAFVGGECGYVSALWC